MRPASMVRSTWMAWMRCGGSRNRSRSITHQIGLFAGRDDADFSLEAQLASAVDRIAHQEIVECHALIRRRQGRAFFRARREARVPDLDAVKRRCLRERQARGRIIGAKGNEWRRIPQGLQQHNAGTASIIEQLRIEFQGPA